MANEIYHRSNWGNAVNDNAWGDVYQKFDATNEMFIRSDYYENSNETDKIMAAINPKPSILLTPTAYNNPPLDNFIQGLNTVKPVLTKSDNLIINGNFATDSDWTKGDGWSISGGVASCDGSQSGFSILSQSGTFNQDKDYEVTFTITSYTSGDVCSVGFTGGGADSFTLNPSPIGVGTYSRVIRANGNTAVSVRVNPGGRSPAFIGSIDNIIVKEVTDADFDFQRLTTATRINSSGNIESVAANLPRIDYTDGTGSLLLEPQSTNLFLNSATLSTQGVTTSAASHTVSFYGTGSITLSGTHSATLNGTGANNRVSLTFTPSSGTLTCTVSGSVTNAQIEALSFATSYIPTSGSTSTRNADVANNAGSSDLINSTEGVLYAEISALVNGGVGDRYISLSSGSDINNTIQLLYHNTSSRVSYFVKKSGGFEVNVSSFTFAQTDNLKIAVKYKENDFALWINGVERATDTSGETFSVGTLQKLQFDAGNGGSDFQGKVKCVAVYKEALTDAQLTALTT